LTLAEDKLEEETYSLIFTSLKHPIRRRILRMLATKPLIFSEIQEQFNIDSGHLTYHLENLGDLIAHCKDGKYRLSSIGDAAVRLMGGVEDQQIVDSSKNRRLAQVVPKVFAWWLP
jgi:predicted transcriptional regulator